jgi:hypothetical protein
VRAEEEAEGDMLDGVEEAEVEADPPVFFLFPDIPFNVDQYNNNIYSLLPCFLASLLPCFENQHSD